MKALYAVLAFIVVGFAAVALAERGPTNPLEICSALGRCGGVAPTPTISVAVPPASGSIPNVGANCTFPATMPCTFR